MLEVEIENYEKSITSISKKEEAEMFSERARFMQEINELIDMFPE